MVTASCEQYPNAQKRVVGKNFLGEWVERKAGGGRLTSSQREAMGVSAGLLTGAEPRPRMENPKPPPPPAHTGPSAFILLCFALGIPSFFFISASGWDRRTGSPESCSVAGPRMIWGGRPVPQGAS